jgi:hypothetical protein
MGIEVLITLFAFNWILRFASEECQVGSAIHSFELEQDNYPQIATCLSILNGGQDATP